MNKSLFIKKLEKTGDILEACIEANIDPKDYQAAYESDPIFKAEIDDTVLNNELLLDKKIEQLSKKAILQMLTHGVRVRKTSIKTTLDSDGEVIKREDTDSTTCLPPPMYAIQYGLSLSRQDDSIFDLIKRLVEEELLTVTKARQLLEILNEPRVRARKVLCGEEDSSNNQELSDELVALAQAQLLGIPIERLK